MTDALFAGKASSSSAQAADSSRLAANDSPDTLVAVRNSKTRRTAKTFFSGNYFRRTARSRPFTFTTDGFPAYSMPPKPSTLASKRPISFNSRVTYFLPGTISCACTTKKHQCQQQRKAFLHKTMYFLGWKTNYRAIPIIYKGIASRAAPAANRSKPSCRPRAC